MDKYKLCAAALSAALLAALPGCTLGTPTPTPDPKTPGGPPCGGGFWVNTPGSAPLWRAIWGGSFVFF